MAENVPSPVGLKAAIRRVLRSQFGRPSGFIGSIVGKIMSLRPSNRERIRWTVSLLDVQPDDRVLEVGFGPGFATRLVSEIVSTGLVAGVDHSEVMLGQATRRNAEAIRDGKVDLRLGSASDLPAFNEAFDKIFTINSIHFWNEPVDCLKGLRELLKPGGLIAVTLQPRSRGSTDETAREGGQEIAGFLEEAGFSPVRLEMKPSKPVAVACALGIK